MYLLVCHCYDKICLVYMYKPVYLLLFIPLVNSINIRKKVRLSIKLPEERNGNSCIVNEETKH